MEREQESLTQNIREEDSIVINPKKRCRRWCYTINNYTQEEEKSLQNLSTTFHIIGYETATTGTKHLQGYLEWSHPKTFTSMKKLIPRGHVEVAKKSRIANVRYCSKTGYVWSSPLNSKEPSWLTQTDQDIVIADINMSDKKIRGKRIVAGMNAQSKVLDEIRHGLLRRPRVIYVYGSSGTGKTWRVIEIASKKYPNEEITFLDWDKSGFAHCVNYDAKCAVIQEFRPSSVTAKDFLQMIDGYGVFLNIKYGGMFKRFDTILIASIFHPNNIYKEEINFQFMRRIHEFINMDENPYTLRDHEKTFTDSDSETIDEEVYPLNKD